METFEERFDRVETGAKNAKKDAAKLTRATNQLKKAAQDGNIVGIKTAKEELSESLNTLQQTITEALNTWSLTDEEVSELFGHYLDELREQASKSGIDIVEHQHPGTWICFPSIIRLVHEKRFLQINQQKIRNIRPSKIKKMLLDNKNKKSAVDPQKVLEQFYKAYCLITKQRTNSHVVPLHEIYRVLTIRHGSNRDYDKTDFAKDIYEIDSGETKQTKSGATVSFPSSTARRSGKNIFEFPGPDGMIHYYAGIQFSGGQ